MNKTLVLFLKYIQIKDWLTNKTKTRDKTNDIWFDFKNMDKSLIIKR
jgi:hypothetical protein